MAITRTALVPELEGYRSRFVEASRHAARLTTGLDADQLGWTPSPGAWSIVQCLDHLVATGERILPRLEEATANARSRGWLSPGPFRYGRFGNWFVRVNGPTEAPPRRSVRSPKIYAPRVELPATDVLGAFLELQEALIRRVEDADGVDLARVRIASPVTRLLRLSLGQWFGLLAGHQERHLLQAQRVRSNPGFPAAGGPSAVTPQPPAPVQDAAGRA